MNSPVLTLLQKQLKLEKLKPTTQKSSIMADDAICPDFIGASSAAAG